MITKTNLSDSKEEFRGTKRFIHVLGGLVFITILSHLAVWMSAYFVFWSISIILGHQSTNFDPVLIISFAIWLMLSACVIAILIVIAHWILPVRFTELHDALVTSAGLLLVLFPVLPISWGASGIMLGFQLNYWYFLPSIGLSLLIAMWIQEHDEHPAEFRRSALPFVFVIGLISSILSFISWIGTSASQPSIFTLVNVASSLTITASAMLFTRMPEEIGIK